MEIKTFKPSSHKVKVLIYGASGSGKTSFAGTAPNVIWAAAEKGLLSVAHTNPQYKEIKSVQDLKDLHTFLNAGGHGYETVVIDTITELNERIKEDLERKRGGQMQIRDWGTLAKQIRGVLRDFADLNMHVIFLAQESVVKDDERIEKITPALNGKSEYEIPRYFDIVGYAHATGGTKSSPPIHHIDTQASEKTLSKDRSRLIGNHQGPDMSFMDWIGRIAQMDIQTIDQPVQAAQPVQQTAPANEKPVLDDAGLQGLMETIVQKVKSGVTINEVIGMIEAKMIVSPEMKQKITSKFTTNNPPVQLPKEKLPDENWSKKEPAAPAAPAEVKPQEQVSTSMTMSEEYYKEMSGKVNRSRTVAGANKIRDEVNDYIKEHAIDTKSPYLIKLQDEFVTKHMKLKEKEQKAVAPVQTEYVEEVPKSEGVKLPDNMFKKDDKKEESVFDATYKKLDAIKDINTLIEFANEYNEEEIGKKLNVEEEAKIQELIDKKANELNK